MEDQPNLNTSENSLNLQFSIRCALIALIINVTLVIGAMAAGKIHEVMGITTFATLPQGFDYRFEDEETIVYIPKLLNIPSETEVQVSDDINES